MGTETGDDCRVPSPPPPQTRHCSILYMRLRSHHPRGPKKLASTEVGFEGGGGAKDLPLAAHYGFFRTSLHPLFRSYQLQGQG